jgi:hypothetical protein
VAGFSHPFGEFTELEKDMRSEGYIVNHISEGAISLIDYELVLVTNYGQKLSDASINITREYDEIQFNEYLSYIQIGGNLSFFLNTPTNMNTEYIDPLNRLGAVIGDQIPPDDGTSIISNFSTSPIFDNVNGILFSGSQISEANSSVHSFGWYKYQFFDGVSTQTQFKSIGIEGSIGAGNYWIFGSTSFLTNSYYHEIIQGTDRVIKNFLTLL